MKRLLTALLALGLTLSGCADGFEHDDDSVSAAAIEVGEIGEAVESVDDGLTASAFDPSAGSILFGRCGGTKGAQCGERFYCQTRSCAPHAVGICLPKPRFCPKIYLPVCGCDGQTYGNACMAAAAGVSIGSLGACPDTCDPNDPTTCGDEQMCDPKPGQCDAAEVGRCRDLPLHCPLVRKPVCGCDGKTYPNDCFRLQAGAGKAHDGRCEIVCDGIIGAPCPDGMFCLHEEGTCQIADGQGVCHVQPEFCTLQYDPVCGCDGQTYGNACMMWVAGVSMDHPGSCCDVTCGADEFPIDTDFDGCPEACGPGCQSDDECEHGTCVQTVLCPDCVYDPVQPCKAPCWQVGECVPCPILDCVPGFEPHDSDGDGCHDTCRKSCLSDDDCAGNDVCHTETHCPGCVNFDPPCLAPCYIEGWCGPPVCNVQILCAEGYWPVDTDGDGCDDTCKKLCDGSSECGPGEVCVPHEWCPACVNATPACDAPCLLLGLCEPEPCGASAVELCANDIDDDCDGATDEQPCQCAFVIDCAPGYYAVDSDSDGCDDVCKKTCDSAADCAPGETCELYTECPGCTSIDPPCFVPCFAIGLCEPACDTAIHCAAGYEAVDTDGDGCADHCKLPCDSYCDCLDLPSANDCALLCPLCGNFWTCEQGYCEEQCGQMPADYWGTCEDEACYGNGDCKTGEYCQIDNFDPVVCSQNVCPGTCQPIPEGQCLGDSGCAAHQHCLPAPCLPGLTCLGVCQWDYPACGDDGSCDAGSTCQCLQDPSCPACDVCDFRCVPDEPVGCYGDQECAAGQHCDAPDVCLPPPGCQPGLACPAVCYGHCRDGCYGAQDCAANEVCNAADVCMAPPGCTDPAVACPDVCYGWCTAP